MSAKNIGEIVPLTESLEDGLKLDICGVAFDKDEKGSIALITTVGGKVYRTYSKQVIETLQKVQTAKFDFKKDTLSTVVKEVESTTGMTYFVLTNPK